jgi:hypothetical protein
MHLFAPCLEPDSLWIIRWKTLRLRIPYKWFPSTALKGISEGWHRFSTAEQLQFLLFYSMTRAKVHRRLMSFARDCKRMRANRQDEG